MPLPDIFKGLEVAVISAALPTITNIQTALKTIAANPGNPAVLASQEAVIVGSINTLILEAPALLPALQSQAISDGALQGVDLLQKLIDALNAIVTTPPAAA